MISLVSRSFRDVAPFAVVLCVIAFALDVALHMTFGWYRYPAGETASATALGTWLGLAFAPFFAVVVSTVVAMFVLVTRGDRDQPLQEFYNTIWPFETSTAKATVIWLLLVATFAGGTRLVVDELAKMSPNLLHTRALLPFVAVFLGFAIARVICRKREGWTPDRRVVFFALLASAAWMYTLEFERYFPHLAHWFVFPYLTGLVLAAIVAISPRPIHNRLLSGVLGSCIVTACLSGTVFPTHSSAAASLFSETGLAIGSARILRMVSDLDFDGYSNWFDQRDCAPFDGEIHIRALEEPENGIDENCVGGDGEKFTLPSTEGEPELDRPPRNVILISIDTLRYDVVGKKVNGTAVTPNLDTFSRYSIVYENAFSVSTHTNEAIPSLLSGTYPSDWSQSGIYFGVEPPLAEVLGDLGYETFGVIALPVLTSALLDGFVDIDNELGTGADSTSTSDATTTRALARLQSVQPGKPFFAWFHYFDPHASYTPIAAMKSTFGSEDSDYYFHDVYRMDTAVGNLLSSLTELGIVENAIIVITSDHGDGLGENNIQTHMWKATNAVSHVPLIIRVPGVPPQSIDRTVSLVDVFPTVIEALDVKNVQPRDGVSIMPKSLESVPQDRPVFIEASMETGPLLRGVAKGQYKLWYDWGRDTYVLNNYVDDPTEYRNLIEAEPEKFEELKRDLWTWWDRQYGLPAMYHRAARWKLGVRTPDEPEKYSGPEYVKFGPAD